MNRCKCLGALLALVCLLSISARASLSVAAVNPAAAEHNCCSDPGSPPDCCTDCTPECCQEGQTPAKAFNCPLTGEELPCSDCCPLNQ